MSRIKATFNFINARRHPDEIASEVETELLFHIEMRARAYVESGMRPDEARRAAQQRFGNFNQVKDACCEITRSSPFDFMVLRMGLHITVAVLAGGLAYWAVNSKHDNIVGVLWQLLAIGVLAWLFAFVRRAAKAKRINGHRANEVFNAKGDVATRKSILATDIFDGSAGSIVAHDEQGRTPVERMFNS